MSTYTKEFLSGGSADGTPISVSNSSGTPTTIHTTSASNGVIDELYLYATNDNGSNQYIHITFDNGSNYYKALLLPYVGKQLIEPGQALADGITVKAYADSTGICVTGWVNRIS